MQATLKSHISIVFLLPVHRVHVQMAEWSHIQYGLGILHGEQNESARSDEITLDLEPC